MTDKIVIFFSNYTPALYYSQDVKVELTDQLSKLQIGPKEEQLLIFGELSARVDTKHSVDLDVLTRSQRRCC